MKGQLYVLIALSPRKMSPTPIECGIEWPQNLSGRLGEEKNLLPPPGIELLFLQCLVHRVRSNSVTFFFVIACKGTQNCAVIIFIVSVLCFRNRTVLLRGVMEGWRVKGVDIN